MTVQTYPDQARVPTADLEPERRTLSSADAQYLQRLTAGFGAFFSIAMLLITLASVVKAETISEYGPWAAFKTTEDHGPVCYIGAEPEKAEGDYAKRGDTYVLVMQRPNLGENDVVSVLAGYTYKPDSEAQVKINGGKPVNLFTRDTRAWAYDSESDAALVHAMKKGTRMVITGISSRGTLTTDTYSLNGFTAAYNDARKACGL